MGKTIDEINELPFRELQRWARFWEVEPWGPARDNWHAARICMAVLLPHLRKGAKLNIKDFLFESRQDAQIRQKRELVAWLESAASATPERKTKRAKR